MSLNLLHSQTNPVIVACAFICALQTGTANSEFSVPLMVLICKVQIKTQAK